VEDVFRPVEEVHVPHADESVRVRDRRRILVIRRSAELGELREVRSQRALLSALGSIRSLPTTRCCTFGDQSRPVTERFLVHLSSSNAQTSLTVRPSSSSLRRPRADQAPIQVT
jgi:hypothetical protein